MHIDLVGSKILFRTSTPRSALFEKWKDFAAGARAAYIIIFANAEERKRRWWQRDFLKHGATLKRW